MIIRISRKTLKNCEQILEQYLPAWLIFFLGMFSCVLFVFYLQNGLGLAYNDARSHLDIGRRVVEGLKPGLAQLGSVWLPLPHLLMVPTIWNDFAWHSGLAGSLQSMISFVLTGLLIYQFLKTIGIDLLGRIVAVFVFATNVNILYLQSIAMTELLLLATMTAGAYELMRWHKYDRMVYLMHASFWIMLSTLIRYDGWFLLVVSLLLVALHTLRRRGWKTVSGVVILFGTMAGFGIVLWLLWNQLIFKDALYFIFGPFSAHAQQKQLKEAGVLATRGDFLFSLKVYWYAMLYNSGAFISLLGLFGAVLFWLDKRLSLSVRLASLTLLAPFVFNVIALFLGHSVLFIQGLSGNTWFNARYGILMMPSIAIFIGYTIDRLKPLRLVLIGSILFVTFFSIANYDAVTIDDARVGSSQKNVSEVSGWLKEHAGDKKGFILISAASHDAIIFSSGLPMKKFIHEGTGAYWESATIAPDRWARWIVMRTNDENDITFKAVKKAPGFGKYERVDSYPFADIYQLKDEYLFYLNTEPVLQQHK